ncbi:unnamed protein product [Schistocephalus solidus]|uniref:Uncharacterized protein n=1 Tax=Schistocephalus solidus TaxID=70667 RepID=A0A183SXR4_SCHSO|nr:unnamed protein product [Schistocephalus solidus]
MAKQRQVDRRSPKLELENTSDLTASQRQELLAQLCLVAEEHISSPSIVAIVEAGREFLASVQEEARARQIAERESAEAQRKKAHTDEIAEVYAALEWRLAVAQHAIYRISDPCTALIKGVLQLIGNMLSVLPFTNQLHSSTRLENVVPGVGSHPLHSQEIICLHCFTLLVYPSTQVDYD